MLCASQMNYVEAAYVITAAPAEEWDTPAHCAELFSAGEWSVRSLLEKYPSDWRYLVKHSGPPPRRLASSFRTLPIKEFRIGTS